MAGVDGGAVPCGLVPRSPLPEPWSSGMVSVVSELGAVLLGEVAAVFFGPGTVVDSAE